MPEIENLGVSVEEYLDGLAAGIDILDLKRLEAKGITTHLALEVMTSNQKIIDGIATPEEIIRGIMILTPSLRQQIE
ncbi:hypothetical protein NIES37_58160 [Tolypothrix tenuis PCC 7101]|uniref:Uncharacterized protein n=1 Tax=Tolypothrix tenuis PCC 7101 TaxID=231146 RepID=A0A1Z4N7V0_9CYAN|nr:hypothetical protein [Aulosira sp. FACHB-113]BAZ01809.1 hypothetical protein NIES37_58160 [Tolypothrix tenuis PCC 7101]BAZ74266.1 hypothetical protein NIES50_28370 [Aulosira laxa NIES-50]